MNFTGFPPAALHLYAALKADNSRESWQQRYRRVYERQVLAPMTALARELSDEFGDIRVLGPVRDTRLSHDKSPYKTYQGAYLDLEPFLGFWLHLDAEGLYASGRYYPRAAEHIARYRTAVAEDGSGAELASIVERLRESGFAIGGDQLRTHPRGFSQDHPRLELLRHRTLDVGRRYGPGPELHSGRAAHQVRETWRLVRPLLSWVADQAPARTAEPSR
ncbi:conserved hypothetical protein [Frankia canadensis]|uniref:TIGR02453 family protein n=1 Tax=Frankia canadensis TaxID=1836972 RepID=A0A2I2L272_9ACTN|nr:DUF2461 domain-containing protein [Frankia canadensis]SNQ52023.1 conserved hypothetical protein [Frankia canadensis]SOU59313.1 conserved hypothetical protein [Frankia canadensis]